MANQEINPIVAIQMALVVEIPEPDVAGASSYRKSNEKTKQFQFRSTHGHGQENLY